MFILGICNVLCLNNTKGPISNLTWKIQQLLIFDLRFSKICLGIKKVHNNQEMRLQGQLREEEKVPSVEFCKVITG